MEHLREWMEIAAMGVEILAVTIMISLIIFGTARWVMHTRLQMKEGYERYRVVLGKTLLVGLELLVAADIIRTVAIEVTPMNLLLLGGLVVVRTFLGWTLTVEVEGRWPWQKENNQERE
ncbi:MAG: DUF1622 domain-containing protein [Pseudomonadota bacterium]